jgi:hypothetical protein
LGILAERQNAIGAEGKIRLPRRHLSEGRYFFLPEDFFFFEAFFFAMRYSPPSVLVVGKTFQRQLTRRSFPRDPSWSALATALAHGAR